VLRSQKLRSQMSLSGGTVTPGLSGFDSTSGQGFDGAANADETTGGTIFHSAGGSTVLYPVNQVAYPKTFGHNDLRQIFGIRYNPSFSRGENSVAVGYADGALRVYENWMKTNCCPSDFDTPDPEEAALLSKGIAIPAGHFSNSNADPNDPITSLKWLDQSRILFLQGSQIKVFKEADKEVTKVEHNHGAMYVCDTTGNANDLGACKRPQRFLVGGTERKVVIYDARTLQETCCLKKSLYRADSFAHSNRISAAKFYPDCDGQVYVTGSWDNSVAVWDCRSGKRERFLDESLVLVGSGPEALDVDRNMILVGSYRTKNPVQLFDFGTCKLVENVVTSKFSTSQHQTLSGEETETTDDELLRPSTSAASSDEGVASSTGGSGKGVRDDDQKDETTKSSADNLKTPSSPTSTQLRVAATTTQKSGNNQHLVPYTAQFSRDGKRILIGGKFVNEQGQGSFVVVRRGSPKCVALWEDHRLSSAVWTVDSVKLDKANSYECALGHADGTVTVLQS